MVDYNVVINDDIVTYGLITYNISYDGEQYIKEGILKTHLYIEELHTLECARFKLTGIEVNAEASGSNDIFYVYIFTYEGLEILDDGTDYELEELLKMYEEEDK